MNKKVTGRNARILLRRSCEVKTSCLKRILEGVQLVALAPRKTSFVVLLIQTFKLPLAAAVSPFNATVPTTDSVRHGVVVPMPSLTAKLIVSLFAPKVSVLPAPCPLMTEFSSKTRLEAAPTSPMTTSEPETPNDTLSEPVVESILKSGLAVVEVAIVHAYG